jgi:hypothetical protein
MPLEQDYNESEVDDYREHPETQPERLFGLTQALIQAAIFGAAGGSGFVISRVWVEDVGVAFLIAGGIGMVAACCFAVACATLGYESPYDGDNG